MLGQMELNWLDYTTIGIYGLVIVSLGLWFAREQHSSRSYFVADRSFSWMPMAISQMASLLSAISYLGAPGESYTYNLKYIMASFAGVLAVPIAIYLFITFFFRLGIISIYEYLERRFNYPVRALGSIFLILMRLAWMATIVSATSIVVNRLTGMPTWQCIVLTAAVSALYTMLGGMKAIVWTDVIQFVLFTGGLVGALIVIGLHDSPKEMVEVLVSDDKLRMLDFRLDPTIRMTTFAAILGGIVNGLNTVSDQVSMQRYLSSKSLRHARLALWARPLLTLPVTLMLFGLGLALYAHYSLHPGMAEGITKGDQAFPHFILTEMPHGLAGLVIAAVFAAAMSSIDSGIHTLSTVTIEDYYKRLIEPDMTDRKCLFLARCLTVFWAVLVTIAALLFSRIGSIVEMMNKLASPFGGCTVGIFVLGTATRRTRAWGAFGGSLIGYGLVLWVTHGVGRVDGQWYLFTRAEEVERISWMWYPVVSFLGTVIPGYLISRFLPKPGPEKLKDLNIWDRIDRTS